jgi:hypothetical protein
VSPSTPDECGGASAARAAKSLLQGRRVALVFDRSQGRLDAYGRTLAYLDIGGSRDFGLTMIKRGYAAEYTYDTAYQRQVRYRAAQGKARRAGKAMWGECGGPDVPARTRSEPQSLMGRNCEPGYDPCVPQGPPDVDCADVQGPINVTGRDPHRLDRDGDGVACEPY